jgi:hypothetical protein
MIYILLNAQYNLPWKNLEYPISLNETIEQ